MARKRSSRTRNNSRTSSKRRNNRSRRRSKARAARAVLADYGGDVEKMREAEGWMFAEKAAAPEGATGKTGLPNAGAASNAAGMEKHWMEVAGLEEETGK